MGKLVITEADVVEAAEAGKKVLTAPLGDSIITDGARDKAVFLGVEIDETPAQSFSPREDAGVAEESQSEKVVSQVTSLIKDRIPVKLAPEQLESLVRNVVTAHLNKSRTVSKSISDQDVTQVGKVCFIKGNRIPRELTGPIPVDEKVMVSDAFRCSENATLAGGYMEWSKASFKRVVNEDEICVVIDGEVSLTVEGQVSVMKQGDMVYLPQGTELLYSAPDRVKLACINRIK